MKLESKKSLAARTLGVGKNRILFNTARISEIKGAITKQDIKDLLADNVIMIREVKGRRTKQKRKTRRRIGSIKKKANPKKQGYVKLTRKLRAHLSNLKKRSQIPQEEFISLRKQIRSRGFRSLAHLKEHLANLRK